MWVAAAAVAVLLVFVLWPKAAPAQAAFEPPPPLPGPTAPPEVASAATPPLAPPPSPKEPGTGAAPPVIDEITVEKKSVCIGEENLVSVRAHTTDGTDPFLHYLVGATPGQKVAVRSWEDDDGDQAPPPLEVKVFGKNNVVTTAPVPHFEVRECKVERVVGIVTRVRANTLSEFELEAKITEKGDGKKPFRPKSWHWSFGDGTTAVTDVPVTVHSYEDRPQKTQFSQVLVAVEVHGEGGEKVSGRTSLQLLNSAFEDLATKGVVTLLIQLTPRFPELGADGVIRQHVRLFHSQDRPVYIHTATVLRHKVDAAAPVIPDSVSPESILGSSVVPPGRGIEFDITLDTKAAPDVFSLEYLVEGKDSEGRPARGTFSVMRPPEKPTAANSNPVADPVLKAKILAAREILHQQYVTDEDLYRLEREGKFANLALPEAQPAPSPQAAPPKEPPPPGPSSPGGKGDADRPAGEQHR